MPRGSKGYTLIAGAAIFIILEVAAIGLMSRTSTLQNIWLNRLTHRVMTVTWGSGEKIRSYFTLKEENEELANENFRLSRQLDYFRDLYPEEVAKAVNGSDKDPFVYIPAKIVKISRNTQHNYIIIDKGSDDGIVPRSGIITNDGVIGIVDAVDRHYSYGLTLMNSKISVSARVGSEGIVAPLVWDGISIDGALLKNIPIQYIASPGDTVRTSGFSDVFPGDIPIGEIVESYSVNGATGEASVRLFQNFSSLRFVTVACNPKKAEIEALEEKEKEL